MATKHRRGRRGRRGGFSRPQIRIALIELIGCSARHSLSQGAARLTNQLTKRQYCRLTNFDYSKAGAYFVTICSKDRKCLFGDIIDFRPHLNDLGVLIAACWNDLPNKFPFVSLDHWIVMPNHVHGILWLGSRNDWNRPLWAIIAAFKARSTSESKKMGTLKISLWQRGFYDRVIRDDQDLLRIRQYIVDNPTQWALDPENPDSVGTR
jgi:REP element-mobilizing transposase RayT